MKKKLAIFDMVGTLLWAPEVYEIAYSKTVKEVYGVNGTIYDTYFSASTIPSITMRIAQSKGISNKILKEKKSIILPTFEKHFIKVLEKIKPKVLPGIPELLELLSKKNFVFALYTGDSMKTTDALLKMTTLYKYFPVEMRSCASRKKPLINRAKLLLEAIKKAERKFGKFSKKSIYLFDDSTKGIESGKSLGIITIGVVGTETFKELKNCNPDYLFKDFGNPKRVIEIIAK
jgi:beta-phosphoglucomutase-like phosphatase (HAD superfamily)